MPNPHQQFLDRLVHDLREPLRSVILFSEILEQSTSGTLKPEDAEALAEIRSGAARLVTLIEGVASYALTFHPGAAPPQTVPMQLALRSALNNLAGPIRESGARIESGPLPQAAISLENLIRIFENLIGNAIKFRCDETLMVRIDATAEDGFSTVTIEDNGLGISAEVVERIFDPFFRVRGREYPGAGLGLTVCRRIVEEHGGRIWAEPVEPRGCRIRFALPAGG